MAPPVLVDHAERFERNRLETVGGARAKRFLGHADALLPREREHCWDLLLGAPVGPAEQPLDELGASRPVPRVVEVAITVFVVEHALGGESERRRLVLRQNLEQDPQLLDRERRTGQILSAYGRRHVAPIDTGERSVETELQGQRLGAGKHAPGAERDVHSAPGKLADGAVVASAEIALGDDQRPVDVGDEQLVRRRNGDQLAGPGSTETRFLVLVSCSYLTSPSISANRV
jgi:hypothetical protein